jgi:ferrous iron transport protein A
VTPVVLVDRLCEFLDKPKVCSPGDPNDVGEGSNTQDTVPLNQIKTGEPFQVVRVYGDDGLQTYLKESGIFAGVQGQIIATNDAGNILIETREGHQLTLTRAVANQVFVQEVHENKENSMKHDKQTLDQLSEGQKAKVQKVNGEGPIRQRLLDMGLTRGTEVTMIKPSPLGDPVEYSVRGYKLSLRKAEAKMIDIAI